MGDKTGIAWTDATWNPVTSLDREWASIPGFPAYAVNREGTIVSFYRDPKRVLSPIVSKSGHHYVFLYRGSRVKCREAGVACFVKQLGANPVVWDFGSDLPLNLKHRAGADPSEWPEDLRVQEWPA